MGAGGSKMRFRFLHLTDTISLFYYEIVSLNPIFHESIGARVRI